jgi:hypothetical protein
MFIFDFFRAFLVFNTKKWPFLGINMVYTLYLDKEKELCLDACFVGKLLGQAFQKYINQLIREEPSR